VSTRQSARRGDPESIPKGVDFRFHKKTNHAGGKGTNGPGRYGFPIRNIDEMRSQIGTLIEHIVLMVALKLFFFFLGLYLRYIRNIALMLISV
jgi:hypothetical protein